MLADHIGISKLRDMAGKSERIEASVSLKDLPRVAGLLYPGYGSTDQRIQMHFEFRRGTQGLPEIVGSASGYIGLCCQRCLGLLEWPVDLTFSLVIAETEAEVEKSAAPFDTLFASDGGIRLLDLCEDEVLASLPLAPMHENLAACRLVDSVLETHQLDNLKVVDGQVADITRPFAGLATLLKQRAGSDSKK